MAKDSEARAKTPTTKAPTTKAKDAKAKDSGRKAKGAGVSAPRRPGRYTPPAPKDAKRSHLWIPVAMFTCLTLGIVVIAGNYLALLPGGEASNNFLIIGLVLLVSGFVLSTSLR